MIFQMVRSLAVPIVAAFTLGACAQAPPPPASTKAIPPVAMSAEPYRPHTLDEYPDFTPEELGRRMLWLIDSLTSFDELSLERVKEVMRLPLHAMPSGASQAFGMHLPASDWYYVFDYYNHPQLIESKNVTYEFRGKTETVDMGPVCAMDYGVYVKALKNIGFQEREDLARYDAVRPPSYRNEATGQFVKPPPQFRRLPVYFLRATTLWCRSSLDAKQTFPTKSCVARAWSSSPPCASERDKPCPSSIPNWR